MVKMLRSDGCLVLMVTLASVAMFPVFGFIMLLGFFCGGYTIHDHPSPDGRFVARYHDFSCGAMDSGDTYVTLLDRHSGPSFLVSSKRSRGVLRPGRVSQSISALLMNRQL